MLFEPLLFNLLCSIFYSNELYLKLGRYVSLLEAIDSCMGVCPPDLSLLDYFLLTREQSPLNINDSRNQARAIHKIGSGSRSDTSCTYHLYLFVFSAALFILGRV